MRASGLVAAALLGSAPALANNVLEARFTAVPIVLDGAIDAAWIKATAAPLANADNPELTGPATCAASGQVRAMWDGAVLYGNNAEGDTIGYEAAMPVFKYLGAADRLALDIYMGGGGHSLKVSQQHNFVRFLDYVLYGVRLPTSAPPGDATRTPTDAQLHWNQYLTGSKDGKNVYDIYYGGFGKMMPWLKRVPSR